MRPDSFWPWKCVICMNISKNAKPENPDLSTTQTRVFQVWKTAGYPGSGKPGFITLVVRTFKWQKIQSSKRCLKPSTHWQHSRLLPKPATKSTVANKVDFVAGKVDSVAQMSNVLSILDSCSLEWSTLWYGWLRGTVVERQSLTGALSLSCARPAADGWPLIWVNRPL